MSLGAYKVRRSCWPRLSVVLAVGTAIFGAYAIEPTTARVASDERSIIAADANTLLNLSAGDIVTVQFSQTAGASFRAVIPIGQELRTLELIPMSVRAPDYKLLTQLPDGSYVSVDSGPVRTLRGRVLGIEGSVVAASLQDDGLYAMMLYPDGHRQWLEPIGTRVTSAAADQYVLYRDDDVLASGGACATASQPRSAPLARHESAAVATGGPLLIAELGIDSDVEYFQDYGSVAATEAQINNIINNMNLQYERDIGVRHIITTIIVRTAEPDGYSSLDIGSLLNQFRDRWVEQMGSVRRDAAQLFTGKSLTGGYIGLAITRSLCSTDAAFSVVVSNSLACNLLACKTDLSAHELGHIWSANHCSCPGWTMNPVLQSANRFHPTFDIPELIVFRDSRTCLSVGDSCDPVGTLDCNTNGVADACDVQAGSSRDGDTNGVPDECQPPPMPQTDPFPFNKTRVVSVSVPSVATTIPGAQTAIRFRLVDLQNPNPPNRATAPPPNFSTFEAGPTCTDPAGCVRWVGKANTFLESQEVPEVGSFRAARLQCTPYYRDWTTEDLVHVVGAELMPSSTYQVDVLAADCMGSESTCSLVSSYNILMTARYGDITLLFNPPWTETQPDALDVVALVNKLKSINGALSKSFTQLQPNVPDLNSDLSALDIVAGVDAIKGSAYPFSGPCLCPSTVACGATPCSTPTACNGGMCVRTCAGGDNDGEPCKNNTHCPSGGCGPGFCRDRCGRCTP